MLNSEGLATSKKEAKANQGVEWVQEYRSWEFGETSQHRVHVFGISRRLGLKTKLRIFRQDASIVWKEDHKVVVACDD